MRVCMRLYAYVARICIVYTRGNAFGVPAVHCRRACRVRMWVQKHVVLYVRYYRWKHIQLQTVVFYMHGNLGVYACVTPH